MKLLTISPEGIPLLDGEPIEGLLGFSIEKEDTSSTAIFTAKIAVNLNPNLGLCRAGNDDRGDR